MDMQTCKFRLTGFAERISLTSAEATALGAAFSVLIPFTFLSNIMLILSLIRTGQVNKKSNCLILILSISDLFMGAVCMPLTVILFAIYPLERQCTLEIIVQTVEIFFGHFSAYMTVTIGIDRYVNIDPTLRHLNSPLHRLFSSSKVWIPILATFGLTTVTTMILTFTMITFTKHHNTVLIVIIILDLVLVLSILVLYVRFYYKIWRHTKTKSVYSIEAHINGIKIRAQYLARLGVTVFIILIALVICYVPFGIIGIYQAIVAGTNLSLLTRTDVLSFMITTVLVYLNSTLNTVIILYRNEKLRHYVSSCLHFDHKYDWNSAQRDNTDNSNQNKEPNNTKERTQDTRM